MSFFGLGNMGGPMAKNLQKSGYKVYGFDVNQDSVSHWAKEVGES